MKKSMNNWCNLFLVFALSLTVFSCNQDDFIIGDGSEITIPIQIPGAAIPELRSIGENEEKAIQTVDVLSFKKTGSGEFLFDYRLKGRAVNNNNLRVALKVKPEEQYLVLVTNARNEVDNIISTATEGEVKAQLLSKLELSLNDGERWQAISPSNYKALPMWGESSAVTITPQTTSIASISLLRMVAKIDVQLDETAGNDVADKFKLKSVRLMNASKNGRIVPDANNISNRVATVPTLAAAPASHAAPLLYDANWGLTDFAIRGAIYTLEREAHVEHLEANCLVIGGLYGTETTESFYRVDLVGADKSHKDILRNHHYIINITDVKSSGHDTWEIAYESKAVNIEADIIIWDTPNTENIVFDGQYYFSISSDSILLTKEGLVGETEDNTVTIKTDFQRGWHVDSIRDTETKAAPDWLTVKSANGKINEQASGNADDFSKVLFLTDEYTSSPSRTAIVYFKAGRLSYPVTIVQNNKESPTITFYKYQENQLLDKTEFIFPVVVGVATPSVQSFSVDWTPRDAELTIYRMTLSGYQYTEFNSAQNVTGVITNGNMGENLGYVMAPPSVGQGQIDNDPLYERAMRLVFQVTSGNKTVTKELSFKQIYYNIFVSGEPSQYITGNTYTLNVKSNGKWTVQEESNSILNIITTSGDGNMVDGESCRFSVRSSAASGQTTKLQFKDADDRVKEEISITVQ